MFPNVEVRHLHAVIVLAEELNFTRAANKLHICQPALSKQINEVEEQNRIQLFVREKKRTVTLTDAGRVFVEEARTALLHAERAIHRARAAHEGAETVLNIGYSPYDEAAWLSTLISTRLPLFPHLRIRLDSEFSTDLAGGVLAGELDLALVTEPPQNPQLAAIAFARAPLFAVLPDKHVAAEKDQLQLQDLAHDAWILYGKRVHPLSYSAILKAAQRESILPIEVHTVLSTRHAFQFVSEHVGVAILRQPPTEMSEGLVVKPLADDSLSLETCVVMRRNEPSRAVSEFARFFLRRFKPLPPRQMHLAISA